MAQQEPYIYNSQQLQSVLIEMRRRLERKDCMVYGGSALIRRKINQIDAVLIMDYFDRYMMRNGEVVYLTRTKGFDRSGLIMKVKEDRDKFIESRDFFVRINDYKNKEEKYSETAKEMNRMLAQSEEPDSVMLDRWVDLERYNEFMALKTEYDKYQFEIDRRRWLLGMIHHPYGYFKKALE